MSIDTPIPEELEQARDASAATIEHHDIGTLARGRDGELLSAARQPPRRHGDGDLRARARRGPRGGRREQLRQIEKALARIESGEYGRCEICGKEIPVERLEASRGRRSASTTRGGSR
jgi:RNA polymerase-binding transcription factor DksA